MSECVPTGYKRRKKRAIKARVRGRAQQQKHTANKYTMCWFNAGPAPWIVPRITEALDKRLACSG